MQPAVGDRFRKVEIDDAGTDPRRPPDLIDLEDAVHPGEDDKQRSLLRNRSPGEPRSGTAGNDRHPMGPSDLDDSGHLVAALRKHHDGGAPAA